MVNRLLCHNGEVQFGCSRHRKCPFDICYKLRFIIDRKLPRFKRPQQITLDKLAADAGDILGMVV